MTKRLTPKTAIRKYCVDNCMVGQPVEVRLCTTDEDIPFIGACPLYNLRMGPNPNKERRTAQIRAKCLDCSGGSSLQVQNCWNTACELYEFRLGKNPAKKGSSKEHMSKMSEKSPLGL